MIHNYMLKMISVILALLVAAGCGGENVPAETLVPAMEVGIAEVGSTSAIFSIKSVDADHVSVLILESSAAAPSENQVASSGIKVKEEKYEAENLSEATSYMLWAVPVAGNGTFGKMKSLSFTTLEKSTEPPVTDRTKGVRVCLRGEDLYVSSNLDDQEDIVYHFRKCMYNNLFTFYRVGTAPRSGSTLADPSAEMSMIINATSSDNIGPWGVNGYSWVGGNHSWKEGNSVHTAKTVSWSVTADGVKVPDRTEMYAHTVTVNVVNEVYDPRVAPAAGASILSSPMVVENYSYTIDGNSMKVKGDHEFVCTEAVNVSRYYGMQSMFQGETAFMTPAAGDAEWVQTFANISKEIVKEDAPAFNLFVERNASKAFQSAYLLPTAMGSHEYVSAGQPVFIFASYGSPDGKAYHVLAAGHDFQKGDKAAWEGVYTWTVRPLVDDSELFCHDGRIDGKKAIYVDALSSVKKNLKVDGITASTKLSILDSKGEIELRPGDGELVISSEGAAYAIVLLD